MRCLTILAVLALASLSLVEGAVNVTAAGRAIRGWRATSISANRINQTAVIADQHHWLAVIHDNPRRRDAPPNPFDGLNQFNVSEGQFIYDVATLENHRAWISVVAFTGWTSQLQYIALVDLNNNNVIANISTNQFQPAAKGSEPPFLAVDSMNEMYAVQGNLVWIFNSDGKQVNYYKLMEQSAPIVSMDIATDGTLWILEDYDSKKQANVLAQYTDGGQYLNSYNLNFTLRTENFLIDLAVSKNEAYITAVGVPLILCWDIIKGVHCRDLRIDGGEREREVGADFAPQVTLFNDTILIVVDESLDAAEAYDLNRRAHSFSIFSREAVVQGASQLRATRGELLVSLDYEEHADVILVDQREGVLIAEFGRPDRTTRRDGIYTAGITVDPRDTVFVSKEFYDVERHIYVNFVDIYEQRRHHLTVNVSSSGQIVFDELTQTIWIADDSQKQPIVNAYAPSNGTLLKSFKFTGFEEEHWITDLQIIPANLTYEPRIAWFVASDFESQRLIVESETGIVAGMLSTPNMHPRSFVLDWLTGYTYIAVEDRRNETAGYDSFIAVFDPKGDFVEMLVSPVGWPHAELIAVTIDFEGTVFAISSRYGAVLEWRRGRRATTSKVVGNSWFNNQLNLADSPPAVIVASE